MCFLVLVIYFRGCSCHLLVVKDRAAVTMYVSSRLAICLPLGLGLDVWSLCCLFPCLFGIRSDSSSLALQGEKIVLKNNT